jgi:ectoine hydroxylase-related dioxygenase (phytanoyl-CoA dioxygenase family)
MAVPTKEQLDHYQKHGYFIHRDLFKPDELHEVTDYIMEHVVESKRLPPVQPHIEDAFFREWCSQDYLLDFVEPIVGPDIALWTVHCFYKPPINGPRTPWHQDAVYWEMEPVVTCSIWLALEQVDEENGCMRVLPGTHLGSKELGHHGIDSVKENASLGLETNDDQFDECTAVSMILDTGDCSVHHSHLIHGAMPNTSGRSRNGLVMRFMPTSSVRTTGDLYLARGRDLSGGKNVYCG